MGLLLLTRTPGERINIGENITLTFTRVDSVVEATHGKVKKLVFDLTIGDIRTEISHCIGDTFFINHGTDSQVKVVLTSMAGRQLKLGIEAPPKIRIFRGEIFDEICAAQASLAAVSA